MSNKNNLSNCKLDHRPISENGRLEYKDIQERIIKRNAVKDYGPFMESIPPQFIINNFASSTEIDYAMSDQEIEKIAQELAQIRINDR